MPRGDGSGPNGMGSMTGRGMGYCSGNDRPGFATGGGRGGFGFGRGFRGRGRGRGFGYGNAPYDQGTQTAAPDVPARDTMSIGERLDEILKRLDSLLGRKSDD